VGSGSASSSTSAVKKALIARNQDATLSDPGPQDRILTLLEAQEHCRHSPIDAPACTKSDSKPRRPHIHPAKYGVMWKFFFAVVHHKTEGICRICLKSITLGKSSSPTPLKNHLSSKHDKHFREFLALDEAENAAKLTQTEGASGIYKHAKPLMELDDKI
jgi:hypothetical protein